MNGIVCISNRTEVPELRTRVTSKLPLEAWPNPSIKIYKHATNINTKKKTISELHYITNAFGVHYTEENIAWEQAHI